MFDRKPERIEINATLSRYLFGPSNDRRYAVSTWIFIRLLALIYLVAFLSIAGNALNWIGSHGDLPVEQTLREAEKTYFAGAVLKYPTLFWYTTLDVIIKALPLVAAVLSLFLLAGFQPAGLLTALYVCFLSYTTVSGESLSSPGYRLLLEVGFLAVFLSSFKGWMPFRRTPDPPRAIRLLMIWLLIRALFSPLLYWISSAPSAHSISSYLLYLGLLVSVALFFFSDSFWARLFLRDRDYIANLAGNKYRGFEKPFYIVVGILLFGLSLLTLFDSLFLISEKVDFVRILLSVFRPFGLVNTYRL